MVDARDILSIETPVLQAGMGEIARRELVVAVTEAGGLGTLGYLPHEAFVRELQAIEQALGGKSFAANLVLPAIKKQHVQACLNSRVPIVTLFYGFNRGILSALKEAGKIVLFQVGSLEEARRVVSAGADGVIVQGFQAGGHIRGNARLEELLPQVREALPEKLVCGAGGIYDEASARAIRSLGADAVCSGTRFLASPEAHAHAIYKQRLLDTKRTIVTNLFGAGWRDPHRVLPNAATEKWCKPDGSDPSWLRIVHAMMRPVAKFIDPKRAEAMIARQSIESPIYAPSSMLPGMDTRLADFVALYAGECVENISELLPAKRIVQALSTA